MMNRYSLSSDSRRWWWTSAFGGGLALTSVTVLGVLVGTSASAHQGDFRDDPGPAETSVVPADETSPCFSRPLMWSVALDGPVPTCRRSGDTSFGIDAARLRAFNGNRGSSPALDMNHIRQLRWVTVP